MINTHPKNYLSRIGPLSLIFLISLIAFIIGIILSSKIFLYAGGFVMVIFTAYLIIWIVLNFES